MKRTHGTSGRGYGQPNFFLTLFSAWIVLVARGQAQGQTPVPSVESGPVQTPSAVPAEGASLPGPAQSAQQLREAFRLLGCESSEVLVNGDRAYAACGDAGVFVAAIAADGALTLREVRQTPGVPRGLFVRAGTVWVESTRTEALPLSELALRAAAGSTSPLPSASPMRPAEAKAASGSVIAVRPLEVTVSLGEQDGLKTGDHIEMYRRVSAADDQDLGEREESLAVGEVVALSDHRARIALGLGELVPIGASARVSVRRTSGSKLAPARRGGLLSIEGTLRPFLPIETLGFAMLGDLALTYRFDAPIYVRAEVRPFGVIVGNVRNSGAFGGFVQGGYDHQYFAVGLGVGALFNGEYQTVWTGETSVTDRDEALDFAVTQNARLGAVDGLSLTIVNAFSLDADDDRWQFGFFEGTAQVALGTRTWLLASGGGGARAGYVFVELGLRRLLRGDGGPGSLFLKPAVGLAGIDPREDGNSDQYYLGPMVSAHVEWRK